MWWHFALVNNRLAEIFWRKKKGKVASYGHCYVKASSYKTKKEKLWINQDTAKYKFIFHQGKYRLKGTSKIFKLIN